MDWSCAKIEGDTITISKRDLEEAKEYYRNMFNEKWGEGDEAWRFYLGEAGILMDLLEQFKSLKG